MMAAATHTLRLASLAPQIVTVIDNKQNGEGEGDGIGNGNGNGDGDGDGIYLALPVFWGNLGVTDAPSAFGSKSGPSFPLPPGFKWVDAHIVDLPHVASVQAVFGRVDLKDVTAEDVQRMIYKNLATVYNTILPSKPRNRHLSTHLNDALTRVESMGAVVDMLNLISERRRLAADDNADEASLREVCDRLDNLQDRYMTSYQTIFEIDKKMFLEDFKMLTKKARPKTMDTASDEHAVDVFETVLRKKVFLQSQLIKRFDIDVGELEEDVIHSDTDSIQRKIQKWCDDVDAAITTMLGQLHQYENESLSNWTDLSKKLKSVTNWLDEQRPVIRKFHVEAQKNQSLTQTLQDDDDKSSNPVLRAGYCMSSSISQMERIQDAMSIFENSIVDKMLADFRSNLIKTQPSPSFDESNLKKLTNMFTSESFKDKTLYKQTLQNDRPPSFDPTDKFNQVVTEIKTIRQWMKIADDELSKLASSLTEDFQVRTQFLEKGQQFLKDTVHAHLASTLALVFNEIEENLNQIVDDLEIEYAQVEVSIRTCYKDLTQEDVQPDEFTTYKDRVTNQKREFEDLALKLGLLSQDVSWLFDAVTKVQSEISDVWNAEDLLMRINQIKEKLKDVTKRHNDLGAMVNESQQRVEDLSKRNGNGDGPAAQAYQLSYF